MALQEQDAGPQWRAGGGRDRACWRSGREPPVDRWPRVLPTPGRRVLARAADLRCPSARRRRCRWGQAAALPLRYNIVLFRRDRQMSRTAPILPPPVAPPSAKYVAKARTLRKREAAGAGPPPPPVADGAVRGEVPSFSTQERVLQLPESQAYLEAATAIDGGKFLAYGTTFCCCSPSIIDNPLYDVQLMANSFLPQNGASMCPSRWARPRHPGTPSPRTALRLARHTARRVLPPTLPGARLCLSATTLCAPRRALHAASGALDS